MSETDCKQRLVRNFNMETTEEYRQRIIKTSDERGEFVTDVDGFVYWWPDGSPNGHLAPHHLRWLADELDRRNKKWQKNIDDYFSANAPEHTPDEL